MKHVDIFTDGACSGNPGPGGWAAILKYDDIVKEISGGENPTTNNKMELVAVISALDLLNQPCNITIYSDSKYIVDSINLGWAKKWKMNGWKKSDNNIAKNIKLWDKLLKLIEIHKVKMVWVKGHSGHKENERCDKLAVAESNKF